MKVSSTETGIETAVTIVERSEIRKMKMTMTANRRPSRPSCASDSIDCSMNGAWLKTTVNFAPSPSASARPGRASRTALDTSTVLPAGVLVIEMVSDGSPLTRE